MNVERSSLWTLREVAAYLRLHPKTVQRFAREKGLPCVRLGGRLRFDADDVHAWVSARKER